MPGPIIRAILNLFQLRIACANFGWYCSVVQEKKISILRQSIFAISLLSPLGKNRDPSFDWIPSPKDALRKVWLKFIGSVVREKKISKFRQCISRYYDSFGKKGNHYLCKLEFLLPKDALYQVWLKKLSGSGNEDF